MNSPLPLLGIGVVAGFFSAHSSWVAQAPGVLIAAVLLLAPLGAAAQQGGTIERVSGTESTVTLGATIVPQSGYPWRVRVETTYALGEDGLTQTVRARNLSDRPAPFGTGPHPYLKAGPAPLDEWTLALPAASVLEVTPDRLSPVALHPVTDRELAQLICALRLCLPDAGIVMSSREEASFRDHLVPLGVTHTSAGSHAEPGGYTRPKEAEAQFEVADHRSPEEVAQALRDMGYEPVWEDPAHPAGVARGLQPIRG